MTSRSRSRDWQADRRAVFERDDHTCRNCDTAGDPTDPTGLRTHPVGAVPLEGTVHESALVTVCDDCFETIRDDTPTPESVTVSRTELFRRVRDTTRSQGDAISDVAAFASLATSLPTTLADADAATVEETAASYRTKRADVLLAADVADAHVARIAAVDPDSFADDDAVRSSLSTVVESAQSLQSTLRTVVDLGETVAAGVGRCHGCFELLEAGSGSGSGSESEPESEAATGSTADPAVDAGTGTGTGTGPKRCPTCGLEAREVDDWHREGGTGGVAYERLFAAINDELEDASDATTSLTEETTVLAEQLTAEE